MSLSDRIKQVIPGNVDDRVIDEIVESTQTVRDGATDVGLKAGNILDDGMNKLTNAIPGTLDDQLYEKVRSMLKGSDHEAEQ